MPTARPCASTTAILRPRRRRTSSRTAINISVRWRAAKRLAFEVRRDGRRRAVSLAPQIRDDELEEQIASYLKSTEEWEQPDGIPAAERHFLRKKRRAALFEKRQP